MSKKKDWAGLPMTGMKVQIAPSTAMKQNVIVSGAAVGPTPPPDAALAASWPPALPCCPPGSASSISMSLLTGRAAAIAQTFARHLGVVDGPVGKDVDAVARVLGAGSWSRPGTPYPARLTWRPGGRCACTQGCVCMHGGNKTVVFNSKRSTKTVDGPACTNPHGGGTLCTTTTTAK